MTEKNTEEHRRPKDSTIKYMYGEAFFCGKPDCNVPLMKKVPGKTQRVLNSRVAHIHAQNPGGARWKEMTEAENRHPDNLILLCVDHSYEVDDKALEDQYPASLMKQWKQIQMEQYEEAEAYILSDQEVKEIQETSFGISEYSDQQQILELNKEISKLHSSLSQYLEPAISKSRTWHEVTSLGSPNSGIRDTRTGEQLRLYPSEMERRKCKDEIFSSLDAAVAKLETIFINSIAHVTALGNLNAPLKETCQDLKLTINDIQRHLLHRPELSPFFDYERFNKLLDQLDSNCERINSAYRGERVEPLEFVDVTIEEKEMDENIQWWNDHSARLEAGRRYKYAKKLEFDESLMTSLYMDSYELTHLPTTIDSMATGFEASIGCATEVAISAADEKILELIEQLKIANSGIVSIQGLWLLNLRLIEEERHEVADKASDALTELIDNVDLSNPSTWIECGSQMRYLLNRLRDNSSDEEIKQKIGHALLNDENLLDVVLPSLADWGTSEDRVTGAKVDFRSFNTLKHGGIPAWMPVEEIKIAIQKRFPDIKAHDNWSEPYSNELEELASQFIYYSLTTPAF